MMGFLPTVDSFKSTDKRNKNTLNKKKIKMKVDNSIYV